MKVSGYMKNRRWCMAMVVSLSMLLGACGGTVDNSQTQAKEPEQTEDSKQESNTVVTGGFQLVLPEHLTPTVNEQGLILTDENMNYQMLVTVRDYSFEERKAEKESFAENVRKGEYEITKDVEIISVAGREYAYFNYMDESSNMLLAYSSADAEHTFANLVLRYGDMTDEEILTDIADLLANAKKTELPDTTLDDIVELNAAELEAEGEGASGYASPVSEVTVNIGETTVITSVPEKFYIMDFSAEEENASVRSFVSSDGNVDITLYGIEDDVFESVEAWIAQNLFIPETATNEFVSELYQEQVDEVMVSYQMVSYEEVSEYSGETITYYELDAVGTLPEGGYIEVSMETSGTEEPDFEMIRDFFEIK